MSTFNPDPVPASGPDAPAPPASRIESDVSDAARTEPPKPLIVGISGSLRPGSTTRLAVESALRGARDAGADTRLIDLREYDLPLAGSRAEGSAAAHAETFRRELRAADGFIWGTPEYHGSFSGVLKNALDLAGGEEFDGKAIGLVGVSGGAQGATHGLAGLRTIGRSLHAWVIPDQASVPESGRAFESGLPKSAATENRLRNVGRQVALFARLHSGKGV